MHAQMSVACAEAGCHLLIEKPIADTLEAAESICRAVEAKGRVATVGYILRFWPGIDRVTELLDEGAIGAPLYARVMLGAKETLSYARTAWRQAGDASVLLLDYSHEFDYLRLYMGEVEQVTCVAAQLGRDGDGLVTAASSILRFASGALGEVHLDYLQHPGRRELDVIGETGRIWYDIRNMRLKLIREDGSETEETWQAERNAAFAAQFEAFAAACEGRREPAVSVRDATRTLAVSLAAVRSSRTGGPERV
jgi:predicted dehydrogenase